MTILIVTYILTIMSLSPVSASVVSRTDPMSCDFNSSEVCPPWSSCIQNETCKCNREHLGYVTCGREETYVEYCYCLTYNKEDLKFRLGACIYNCGMRTKYLTDTNTRFKVPSDRSKLDAAMCSHLNREGTLCERCNRHHSPPAYSYAMNCIFCPRGHRQWWNFILAAFGPLTIFYVFLLLCKVSITPAYLYSFVFYSQLISLPVFMRSVTIIFQHSPGYLIVLNIMASLYGIWNLDFFRGFYKNICLDLGTLDIQVLEYSIAVYPLLLILVTHVLTKLHHSNTRCVVYVWKPFGLLLATFNRNWESSRSLMDVFTVFFILSLTKIIYVSVDLLIPTKVYTLAVNGTQGYYHALYFDGTREYFGKEHRPYGILAVIMMLFFILLPTSILFFFPFRFFQVILNRLPFSATPLFLFVDKFQGFYKNGTDVGTKDCRIFPVFHIMLFLLLSIIYSTTLNSTFFSVGAAIMIVSSMIYAFIQPYKSVFSHYNKITVLFFLLIALQFTLIGGSDVASTKSHKALHYYYIVIFALGIIPLVYITVLVLHKVSQQRWYCKCRRRREYIEIQDTVDIFN